MTNRPPLGCFEAYGIEIEYMVVGRDDLNVLPVVSTILNELGPATDGVVERGPIAWSNELAAHVIEIKTNGPVRSLSAAHRAIAAAVVEMNDALAAHGACLLPSGMHPWMLPDREFELYPVDDEGYYATFDRIFDCRGHGWSNLQSMHVNLPFADDAQFARLHSAVRLLLPLLPALSASSPFQEGRRAGPVDQRLFVYRSNAAKVPSVSGVVVPQHVASRSEYEAELLQKIYDELLPHDPEGLLRYEWVNARGAIARFDRMAVEIRVLDSQECAKADLAVAQAVTKVLQQRYQEDPDLVALSSRWDEQRLAFVLWQVAREGDRAVIEDSEYLALWGLPTKPMRAAEVWQHLLERLPRTEGVGDALELVRRGCLARRILAATGDNPGLPALHEVYAALGRCLAHDDWFDP